MHHTQRSQLKSATAGGDVASNQLLGEPCTDGHDAGARNAVRRVTYTWHIFETLTCSVRVCVYSARTV